MFREPRVRRLPLSILAVIFAALAPGASAAQAPPPGLPAEVYLLPGGSAMVMGFDVRGFLASKLWADISSGRIGSTIGMTAQQSADMAKEVQSGFTKAMDEMEKEAGFRADRDLDSVLVAMSNPDAPSPEVVGLAFGRFDSARLLAAMAASETKGGGKLNSKQTGGVTIQWTEKADGKKGFAVAVLSNRLVAFGELPQVDTLVQAHAAGKKPFQSNAEFSTRLRALKPAGLFVVASEAFLQKMASDPKSPPPFPMPKNFAMRFEFDGGTELVAQMATEAAAKEAVATIQGQLAMIGGALSQDADASKAGIGKILSGLTVEAQGRTLRVATSQQGFGVGALAAIAIPSLLRARVSANEASAIGDIRTVISAQAAYQSTNQGFYGELPCMAEPATCMKGYTGPIFLDKQLASLETKNGYRRAFFPGKRGKGARSVAGYAYVAVPAEPGKTGVRSFCGDDTGVIVFDPKGADIKPVGGSCPSTLEPLR